MISNIFLDFFNRDSREIYGLFSNTLREQHIAFLTEATNVAAFLCRDYCVLPPGFLAECDIARDAILRRSDYVIERLIRLPLREDTLEKFWDKKHREYSPFRAQYSGLFEQRNELMLRSFAGAIIARNAAVADEILRTWEEGPDVSKTWQGLISLVPSHDVEIVRETPRQIRDDGFAVTWIAIRERLKSLRIERSFPIRYLLQNNYFLIYLREYDLRVITSLPFARVNFVYGNADLTNDYQALKAALGAFALWDCLAGLSAEAMMSLRSKFGCQEFRRKFDLVAGEIGSIRGIGECFGRVAANKACSPGLKKIISAYAGSYIPAHGYEPPDTEIDAIAERLGDVEPVEEEMNKIKENVTRAPERLRTTNVPTIAICVALDMERQVLVKRWNLTDGYPEMVWRGKLGGVNLLMFGTEDMGRVSASIATMRLLEKHPRPAMLLVVGIAGGFERQGIKLGDILIPKNVADLATRKVGRKNAKGKDRPIPEFRPKEFRTDDRLLRFVQSAKFNKRSWESQVVEEADWPEGLRPTIHDGPIASLDEVVSSNKWIDALCDAWPKLSGVEMEAGGVCAAAEANNLKVAVLRGVSDLADPAKSDDVWRRRAVKTLAHLLETVDFNQLLAE